MTTRNLSIRLSAEGEEQLKAKLRELGKEGEAALRAIERGGQSANTGLVSVNSALGALKGGVAGLAAAASLGGLTAFAKGALAASEQLADLSERLGVGVEELQAWRYAAFENGSSAEEMDSALAQLTRRIGESARGSGEAKEVFETLGLSLRDANGNIRSTESVLREVADRLTGMQSPAERAAILGKLLGEEVGVKLAVLIGQGSDGLDRWTERAREAGLVMDRELVERAAQVNKEWDRMVMIIGTRAKGALLEFVTELRKMSQGDFSGPARTIASVREDLELVEKEFARLPERTLGYAAEHEALIRRRIALMLELWSLEGQGSTAEPSEPTGPRLPVPGRNPRDGDLDDDQPKGIAAFDRSTESMAREAERRSQAEANARATVTAAIDRQIFAMEAERRLMGETARERFISEQLLRAEEEARRGNIALGRDRIEQIQIEAGLLFDARKAEDEHTRAMEEGKRLYEQTQTPAERYAATIERLNELHARDAIDTETWRRAQREAAEEMARTAEKGKDLAAAMKDGAQAIGTAMEDAVVSGKGAREILSGLEQDLLRIAWRLAVTKPLENAIGGLFDNLDWGGIFGAMFPGGGYSITTGSAGAASSTMASGLTVNWFHRGGIAGTDSGMRSRVPADLFAGAPRYHRGGIVGRNEVPAILERGEEVLTRTDPRHRANGGGGTVVQVIDQRSGGAPAQVSRGGRTSDGRELVRVLIGELNGDVDTNGPFAQRLQQRFGLRYQGGF